MMNLWSLIAQAEAAADGVDNNPSVRLWETLDPKKRLFVLVSILFILILGMLAVVWIRSWGRFIRRWMNLPPRETVQRLLEQADERAAASHSPSAHRGGKGLSPSHDPFVKPPDFPPLHKFSDEPFSDPAHGGEDDDVDDDLDNDDDAKGDSRFQP